MPSTRSRSRTIWATAAALVLTLYACSSDDAESTADPEGQVEEPAPETGTGSGDEPLDLATLTAVVDGRDYDVESLETAYTGEVGDDLFIGIAIADGPADEPREITVYLCDDRFIGEWMTGEIDASGVGTLVKSDSMLNYYEDGDLRIDVEVSGDEVRGTVTFGDVFEQDFTAEAADDDAGLFRAEATIDEFAHQAGWIVFNDGRRVGTYCFWARNPMTGEPICGCKKIK